jgi:DNA invertase Pin-like site-specific DNA recombinase
MDADRDRDRMSRRAKIRVAIAGVLLVADGVLAFAFGAPGWFAIFYVALGVMVPAGWVWLRRAHPGPRAPQPEGLPPAQPDGRATARQALGYVYVDGGVNEPGLAAQSETIRAWSAEHGLALATVVHDGEVGGDGRTRPSLCWALEQIDARRAELLVVPRLRDLSSNVADLTPLLRWFTEPGRTLIAIDLRLDTSTEAGRLAAFAVAGVGGWEHERISARTRRGLEAARSRGAGQGRTAVADVPELQDRIAQMREHGMTLQAIADALNEAGVPTLRGGTMWRPSSVQRATGYRRPSSESRGIELPKGDPPNRRAHP